MAYVRSSVNISFRLKPAVAASLDLLAKLEDRTRTEVLTHALKHYFQSYYPTLRRIDMELHGIKVVLSRWNTAVRAEGLWDDEAIRSDALSAFDEAFEGSARMVLYRGPGVKGAVSLHIYRLNALLLEAKALRLESAPRSAFFDISVRSEREIAALETLAKQLLKDIKKRTKRMPPSN